MCLATTIECSCGGEFASLHHLNSILPGEAVAAVHCPSCAGVTFDGATMVRDNGWVIEYDMDIARSYLTRTGVAPDSVTPQLIFDEGYATWNGLTPTDAYDKAMELNDLAVQFKGDKRAYFEALKRWTQDRALRLAEQGWRKAQLAV
jgi:hypothetical protein